MSERKKLRGAVRLAAEKAESSGLDLPTLKANGVRVLDGKEAASEMADMLPRGAQIDGALAFDYYNIVKKLVRTRWRVLGEVVLPFGARPDPPIRYLSRRARGG